METGLIWSRTRLVLVIAVLWLALTNAIVWAGSSWGSWSRTHFDLPIAPGRSVHIHIGDPFGGSGYSNYAYGRPQPLAYRPLRLSVRYRIMPGWAGRQVLLTYIPTWLPLALMPGAVTSLVLVTLLPGRLSARPR